MVAAAQRAGKRLMINFSYRFSAASRGLKAQVEAGVFGEFYFGRTVWHRRRGMPGFGGWFGTKALAGGGPLIDLGVHRLDLALWLMGYPKPTWVLGSTSKARPRSTRSHPLRWTCSPGRYTPRSVKLRTKRPFASCKRAFSKRIWSGRRTEILSEAGCGYTSKVLNTRSLMPTLQGVTEISSMR